MLSQSHPDDSDDDLGGKESTKATMDNETNITDFDTLKQKLHEKSREVEKLNVLLEACEPLPGMSIDKYKKFVLTGIDDALDFRDSKIISLAKKIRNLNMKLNKSNALNEKGHSSYEILKLKYDQLVVEFEQKSKEDRRSVTRSDVEVQLQRDLNVARKQVDELKHKQSQLCDEIRNLQRILRSELGEYVTIDQALMDEGWKGRARQIEMLKIKLKRYENSHGFNRSSRSISTSSATESPSAITDLRVHEDLAEISAAKKQNLESLLHELTTLQVGNNVLEMKLKGFKSRVQSMEKEGLKQKQQIQLLLHKANTDDELIEVLREEIDRLRKSSTTSQSASSTSGTTSYLKTNWRDSTSNRLSLPSASSTEETESEHLEITRLKRLCKQQSDQLETQENLIRELRCAVVK